MADLTRLVLEVDSTGVVKASGNLDIFKKKAEESSKSTNTLDDSLRNLNLSALASTAGVLGLYKALQTTLSAMKNVATSTIQTYSHFESMQKGLETFFQSAEKGKTVFEDLRRLSNETTFGVDELANSATQLLNTGTSAQELNKTLIMLGNTAQGDKAKFAELTSVFAKIQSTGKAGSMQLQQLALRGLPIYDVLKKIGVQGTATADDIKRAFEEMTKEGGQFYNAMENINDTISGKEGFISDYFREMMVNFAEVTGLADAYKNILDVLKEAIGNVSDWLLKINENPISKAIFNGVLLGTLTAVVGLIAGSLISAITALNAKLAITATLTAIINPAVLITAGVIAGIAGLTTAWVNYQNTLDETAEKQDKVLNPNYHNSQNALNSENIESAQSTLNSYSESIKKIKNELKEVKEEIQGTNEAYKKGIIGEAQYILSGVSELKEKEDSLENQISQYEKLYDSAKRELNALTASKAEHERIEDVIKKINEAYDNTPVGKLKTKLEEVNDELKAMKERVKDVYSDDLKEKLNAVIKDLEKQEIDLKVKIAVENQEDWQKTLQKAFNFFDKDVYNGATKSTVGAIDYFKNKIDNYNSIVSKFSDITGANDWVNKQQYADDLEKAFLEVVESVKDGTYTGTEKSLEEFANQVREAKDAVKGFDDKLKDWTNAQIKNGNVGGGIAGTFAQKMVSQSNDAQNFISGFAQGGVIGGVASAVGGALAQVASEVDGMDDVMNPLTAVMRTLTPLFELLVGVLKPFFTTLEGIQQIGHAIVEGILRPFEPLLNLIKGIFERLANVFTELFNSLDPIIEVINMIVDTILNAVDALLEPLIQTFRMVGEFLNIFTEMAKPLIAIINAISKAFKLLATPLRLLALLFQWIAKGIEDFFSPFINALEEFGDWVDTFLGDKEKEEKEKKDLTQAYKDLLSAIRDMEEYYDERQAKLRGEQAKTDATNPYTKVNDMILTPHGNFSTAPDDYIIATKNPSALGQGNGGTNVVMNVKINNTVSDKVSATATQSVDENGFTQLLVNISQKVASDFARGSNGWDNAVAYRSVQASGRRVSL